jgi:hypothetical protein
VFMLTVCFEGHCIRCTRTMQPPQTGCCPMLIGVLGMLLLHDVLESQLHAFSQKPVVTATCCSHQQQQQQRQKCGLPAP